MGTGRRSLGSVLILHYSFDKRADMIILNERMKEYMVKYEWKDVVLNIEEITS